MSWIVHLLKTLSESLGVHLLNGPEIVNYITSSLKFSFRNATPTLLIFLGVIFTGFLRIRALPALQQMHRIKGEGVVTIQTWSQIRGLEVSLQSQIIYSTLRN